MPRTFWDTFPDADGHREKKPQRRSSVAAPGFNDLTGVCERCGFVSDDVLLGICDPCFTATEEARQCIPS